MRGYEFLDKIGFVDAELVINAENPVITGRKIKLFPIIATLSACAVIGTIGIFNYKRPDTDTKELPMLVIEDNSAEGYGFEGYAAYDISELVNNNPWSENCGISVMPVYKNTLEFDEQRHIMTGGDFEKMREFLDDAAAAFSINVDLSEIKDDLPSEKYINAVKEKFAAIGEAVPERYFDATSVICEYDGMKFQVDENMTLMINFEPPVSLPDEYNFTHYASYEECIAVSEYLKEKYSDFIGYKNPCVNIYGGDYDIYNNQSYHTEFFDSSGDITEQIVNYNFNRTAFYCDDDGKLFIARKFKPDLSEKVGDYPIISVESAKKLLLKGDFITSCPIENLLEEKYIAKAELIYRTREYCNYYIPYYRFYIELPEFEKDGMKTYGAFYIPAVDGEYLSYMTDNISDICGIYD